MERQKACNRWRKLEKRQEGSTENSSFSCQLLHKVWSMKIVGLINGLHLPLVSGSERDNGDGLSSARALCDATIRSDRSSCLQGGVCEAFQQEQTILSKLCSHEIKVKLCQKPLSKQVQCVRLYVCVFVCICVTLSSITGLFLYRRLWAVVRPIPL